MEIRIPEMQVLLEMVGTLTQEVRRLTEIVDQRTLTIQEAAKILNYSYGKTYDLIITGELKATPSNTTGKRTKYTVTPKAIRDFQSKHLKNS